MDRLAMLQARKSAIKARLLVKADWQEEFVLRMQFIDVNHEIFLHRQLVNKQLSKEGTAQHAVKATPKLL
jgi:hypothetical protein